MVVWLSMLLWFACVAVVDVVVARGMIDACDGVGFVSVVGLVVV